MVNKADDHIAGALSSEAAVDFFDRHAEYYAKSQYQTTRRTFINARHEQIVQLLSRLTVPADATVLDAGCGPGNLLPELATRFRRVCAMDASSRMLQIARLSAHAFGNVTYQVGRIESLPYETASFDLVCSAGVIEYLRDWSQALHEMHRILRPGGLLILPTTNALAPAHWLRPFLEPIARTRVVARTLGIVPGTYQLWYHRIPEFKRRLDATGLVLERERHFYLTLPRPADRLAPEVARRVERFFDRYMSTRLRHIAEGYLALVRKPPDPSMYAAAGPARAHRC